MIDKIYLLSLFQIILWNEWGLGIGDWGFGICPITNPQSPITNPHIRNLKILRH